MGKVMEYKGYRASTTYDSDDEVFIGKVLGINDSLNFHGESVSELKETFHNCIDNYLEMCEAYGREPDKEYKGVFNVRISPETHKALAMQAEEDGITLNQHVANILDEAVKPTPIEQAPVLYVVKTNETMHIDREKSEINYSEFSAVQETLKKGTRTSARAYG